MCILLIENRYTDIAKKVLWTEGGFLCTEIDANFFLSPFQPQGVLLSPLGINFQFGLILFASEPDEPFWAYSDPFWTPMNPYEALGSIFEFLHQFKSGLAFFKVIPQWAPISRVQKTLLGPC